MKIPQEFFHPRYFENAPVELLAEGFQEHGLESFKT